MNTDCLQIYQFQFSNLSTVSTKCLVPQQPSNEQVICRSSPYPDQAYSPWRPGTSPPSPPPPSSTTTLSLEVQQAQGQDFLTD
jgi:hypothetical protein